MHRITASQPALPMKLRTARSLALGCACLATACSSLDALPAAGGSGGGGQGGGTGGVGGAPPIELSVALPQAVDGALQVCPAVYDSVPLRIDASAGTEAVEVELGSQHIEASQDGAGRWSATLPVGELPDGVVALRVTAQAAGADPAQAEAELVVASEGVRLSFFEEVGQSRSPRLHRVGDALWLSYSDRFEPAAALWLRRIDGAGRWVGERIRLVDGDAAETLHGRTAFGENSIAVLYQAAGMPYATHFKIVDSSGAELMAPLALDPPATSGSYGGDLTFHQGSYLATWRVHGASGGEVRWLRVDEQTHEVTGPVVVAASGPATAADIIGGFEPFSFVSIEAVGSGSMVSFVRGRYHSMLELEVPKSELALLDDAGTVLWTRYAGIENDLTWHRDARLSRFGDTVVALWSASNLTHPDPMPPNWLYATQSDADGQLDALRGEGHTVVEAPDDRDEPFLLAHPDHQGVLAWADHRAYTLDPPNGHIELYAASIDADWQSAEPTGFGHSRLYGGLSQINGALAGTNLQIVWLDIRHSVGMETHHELWFDTAWY